jgi:hypothetical protein
MLRLGFWHYIQGFIFIMLKRDPLSIRSVLLATYHPACLP